MSGKKGSGKGSSVALLIFGAILFGMGAGGNFPVVGEMHPGPEFQVMAALGGAVLFFIGLVGVLSSD